MKTQNEPGKALTKKERNDMNDYNHQLIARNTARQIAEGLLGPDGNDPFYMFTKE